ncbi:MAG: UrcA family protein [Steroidobacteraceae bacterium]
MKKLTVLIAVAGITAVICANAQAGGISDVPTETVRYATADAATVAAVAVLYRRIDAAAGRVCGERMAPGTPFVSRTWQHCVQRATREALAHINTPAVAAYAAAHGIVVLDAPTASRN